MIVQIFQFKIIRLKLKILFEQANISLVIIDYLQLMENNNKNDNRVHRN